MANLQKIKVESNELEVDVAEFLAEKIRTNKEVDAFDCKKKIRRLGQSLNLWKARVYK